MKDKISSAMKYMLEDGQITELRALDVKNNPNERPHTVSGYFNDIRKLTEAAEKLSGIAKGIYFIPNPFRQDLLARADNHVVAWPKSSTSDDDILRRQWLLVDLDPIRPTGISSKDEEHQYALDRAMKIRDRLSSIGWPSPVLANSGNGAHLMYRVDLPVEDGRLIQYVLQALALRFDDDNVQVDLIVHNPARIWRLYGTKACKGDDTADRPHRISEILWGEILDKPEIVAESKLRNLASEVEKLNVSTRGTSSGSFDLQKWINDHSVPVSGPRAWGQGKVWTFDICPWDSNHTNRSAFIVQHQGGGIAAGCHHNGCKGKGWTELRKKYEPNWVPSDKSGYHQSELGNAKRFVDQHGTDLRYCPQQDIWYQWNDLRWEQDLTNEVMRRSKATSETLFDDAIKVNDPEHQTSVYKWAISSQLKSRLQATIDLAKSEPSIPVTVDQLDANPWLLNVKNGILDLKTMKLMPHDKNQLLTKPVPVEWKGLDVTHPDWERFLDSVTGGKQEWKEFLQRAVGYSLTGDVSEEVLFFVHGPAASGKSTFIEALKSVLADYGKTADFETFLKTIGSNGPRNDIARLAAARFVASVEVDEGKQLAEGIVKSLTGGDSITARFLYKEAFEFTPQFKLWMAANHAPRVDAEDAAMWRRIIRIPFDQVIPKEKRDPKI